MTYEDLDRRYRRISKMNTMIARRVDTAEAYEKARRREKLIRKAFFADCKRYLNGELRSKE